MRITLESGEPFAFAGLWDTWRDPRGDVDRVVHHHHDGGERTSSSPSTTACRSSCRKNVEPLWLDSGMQDVAALVSLLAPYPSDAMTTYEVSPLVNSAANDGPDVIAPAQQGRLM